MRTALATLAATVAALVLAAPAFAGTVAAPNACYWSSAPPEWNNETLTLSATPSADRAGAGTPLSLSGFSARIVLPRAVLDVGVAVGLLKEGENQIPVRAWAAARGTNTAEGIRVLETSTTVTTTIVLDPEGMIVSATPIDVQAPFPDSTWTVATDAPTNFAQAEAGTLPKLPVGLNGALRQPLGSIFIAATLGPSTLTIDCQPGVRSADLSGPVPGPGLPFASVAAPDGTPPPPATVKPTPTLTLRSTKLKADKGTVAVKLRCAGAPCTGTLRLTTAGKVRVGKRKQLVTVTRATKYSLAPNQTRTIKLELTAAARKLLEARGLTVRVTTTPAAGEPLARKLTLARQRSR